MILNKVDYEYKIDRINQAISYYEKDKTLLKKLNSIKNGLYAEKDMAYKLDIHLDKYDDIMVINDLKIKHKDKTAQIDHLVLTCYSSYFIETKTSWGEIHIDANLDWFRNNIPFNQSPINQSKDHEEILYAFLNSNLEKFRGKLLGMQKGIGSYVAHPYIAIGNKASINRQRLQFY